MDNTDGGFDAAKFAQHFNQTSPEYGPHFNDIYRDIRARCPVAHTDAAGGLWVVTRYADIMRAARDYEAFSSRYGNRPGVNYAPGPPGEAPRPSFLPIELDPPLHGLYRNTIEPLFSPHAVTELAPWLLAVTDQLIDAIIEQGRTWRSARACTAASPSIWLASNSGPCSSGY